MSRYLVAGCCVILLALAGCKDKAETTSGTTPAPATQPAAQKAACVICIDHEMDVDANTPMAEYQGKKYYFCSDGCKEEFEKDPQKAIAKFEAKKGTSPAGA